VACALGGAHRQQLTYRKQNVRKRKMIKKESLASKGWWYLNNETCSFTQQQRCAPHPHFCDDGRPPLATEALRQSGGSLLEIKS
jgi:hypothetical protein